MCPLGERTSQICGFEFHGTMRILGKILGFDMDFHDFTGILNRFDMNFMRILPISYNTVS